ncbi:cobalamin biosynthesis protein [Bosea sp. (in: a-proteobacteria)]|uniref:cobalamin biosynthesis protein n=1 Tax=Bosea sp. (in: a-proteobacteria) TaxID=1871050 RepID=UPI00260B3596|nr:cobalamin biosynthesis protein [Bosea sp. (in: a-proteobacteria)]MCO5090629.1 cobalamin biosynthesis protein [Bosea sp. (in: a-proteobacteria)]
MSAGRLVAGIGIRPGTGAADILACLDAALAGAGIAGEATPLFATLASRAGEAGIVAAAAARAAGIVAVPDEALKGFEAACATRSTRIAALYGVGSVAEAAALAAAGPGGRLLQPRIASGRVTCALARSVA